MTASVNLHHRSSVLPYFPTYFFSLSVPDGDKHHRTAAPPTTPPPAPRPLPHPMAFRNMYGLQCASRACSTIVYVLRDSHDASIHLHALCVLIRKAPALTVVTRTFIRPLRGRPSPPAARPSLCTALDYDETPFTHVEDVTDAGPPPVDAKKMREEPTVPGWPFHTNQASTDADTLPL